MSLGTRFQDPDASLDYSIDWTAWLQDGETITSSDWTITPTGVGALTEDSSANSTTDTTIWVSGGVLGASYTVTNHIETSHSPGRVDDRSFVITIAQQ